MLKLIKKSAGGLPDPSQFRIDGLLGFHPSVYALGPSIVKNVGLGAAGSSILGFWGICIMGGIGLSTLVWI